MLNRQFFSFQRNLHAKKGKILNIDDHFVIYQRNVTVKTLLGLDIFIYFFMFVSKFHLNVMSDSLIAKKKNIVSQIYDKNKKKIQRKIFL